MGNVTQGRVVGNGADNVHSFLDIEVSSAATIVNLIVDGNTAVGLRRDGAGTEYGKGLWVNGPTNLRGVNFGVNTISYFYDGITTTAADSINLGSSIITHCVHGLYLATTRKFTVTGGMIDYCTDAIYHSAVVGYAGGQLIGVNIGANITTNAINTSYSGGTPGYVDRLTMANCDIESGALNYTSTLWVEEYGNKMAVSALTGASITLSGPKNFVTGNTGATTITAIDCPYGETKVLVINDANTTIDFTQAAIVGNAGASRAMTNGDICYITRVSAAKVAVDFVAIS